MIKNLILILCATVAFSCAQRQSDIPNIIVILADDLGYGDINALNPSGKIPTPYLDRLVGEGMHFTDAHSSSSVCTPTRYGLLTGRYNWRTRLKSRVLLAYDRPLIEPGRLTLASMLKEKGYETACIGKWHLGMEWTTKNGAIIPLRDRLADDEDIDFTTPVKGGPNEVGFDYFFGISGSANFPPYAYIEDDRLIQQPTLPKPDSVFGRPGWMVEGWDYRQLMPTLTNKATDYIKQQADNDQPFFLYFPLTAPHTPIAPTAEAVGRSEAGNYGDFVTVVDETVGKIIEVLKEKGIEENTLLVFTSDNGSPGRTDNTARPGSVMSAYGHEANNNRKGLKGDIWEGGHRVPLIGYWPGTITPGSKSDRLLCLTDVMATLADLFDFELPPGSAEDSFSFLAVLTDKTSAVERESIIHHSFDGMFGIRKGDWKLVDGLGSGGFSNPTRTKPVEGAAAGQLYDLADDPKEKDNVWMQHPAKVDELRTDLLQIKRQGFSRPGAQEVPAPSFLAQLKPAPVNGGFRMDGYFVWGMSVIEGKDGKYHGFASRWPTKVDFKNWVTNSEIVHAIADRPEGPYRFESVVFERRSKTYWDGQMTHNPTIHKSGDTYLLYYIGTTYDFPFPEEEASLEDRSAARANQCIGLATSKSPYGPWTRQNQPILKPRPGKWDALLTVNPAVCVKPDGSILMLYKSAADQQGLLKLGVTGANHFEGPYKRLADQPIFEFEENEGLPKKDQKHLEDPYIWWSDDHFELIMKDMNGNICGEKGGGIYATSADGIHWQISEPAQAYSRLVLWDDGSLVQQAAFERPQLLIQKGKPTHLFAATGKNAEDAYWKFDETWNMVIPLVY